MVWVSLDLEEEILIWFPLDIINHLHHHFRLSLSGAKSDNTVDFHIVLASDPRPIHRVHLHPYLGQLITRNEESSPFWKHLHS